MRRAADDFLSRFGSLADEVITLRQSLAQAHDENAELRAELAKAVSLFRDAQTQVAGAKPARRGSGRAASAMTAAASGVRRGMRPRAASSRGEGGTRASRVARMAGRRPSR